MLVNKFFEKLELNDNEVGKIVGNGMKMQQFIAQTCNFYVAFFIMISRANLILLQYPECLLSYDI